MLLFPTAYPDGTNHTVTVASVVKLLLQNIIAVTALSPEDTKICPGDVAFNVKF
jgi:hypothetical protein